MWTPESFTELLKRHGCDYVYLGVPSDFAREKYGSRYDLTVDGTIRVEELVAELNGSEEFPLGINTNR